MSDRGLGLGLALMFCLGCERDAQQACSDLRDAIWETDGLAVFDVLLQNTKWSVATVHKLHRQMARDILENYPAPVQQSALSRLQLGPTERELFGDLYHERYAADFKERVAPDMPLVHKGPRQALCGAHKAFVLERGRDGNFGLSELDAEWEAAKLRAFHDQETVTKNADLYRRERSGRP